MAKYVEMMLPCRLTESEIQEKVRKLVTFKKDLSAIFGDELKYKLEIKKRKENVEPTISSLEREITEESEQRRVRCQLVFDTDSWTVATMRTDTWEQVGKSREMTKEEIENSRQMDLVREAERHSKAKEEKAAAPAPAPELAPDGAATDPQTREDAPESAGKMASDGAEPADLEAAPGDLPGNSDPDGWLAEGEAAQAAAVAQEGATPSLEADSAFPAAQEAQEGQEAADGAQGDLLAAGETWALAEVEKGPEGQQAANEERAAG